MKRILFVLGALSGLVAWADIRAVTPVPQCADPNSWWMKRHAGKMALVKQGGAPIVFLGDSITHNWEGPGRAQWAKYFAEGRYRALNLGYGADRTEHVLWRLDHGELDGYTARAVVLMIGTNNTGHFPFEQETPADTIIGIRAVLDKIRAKQPLARIILLPIFPRGYTAQDHLRARNRTVNAEVMRFADGKRIVWCDFTSQFLAPNGTLAAEIFPDGLHPSAYGYEVWAAAVLPYLEAALTTDPDTPLANRFAPFADPAAFYHGGPVPAQAISLIGRREHWWRDPEMWFHKLQQHRCAAAAGKGAFDVVLLGDSIMNGWEGNGAAVLAELRKTYSVLPLGIGGDRVQHNIWRARNGELSGYAAKCVAVMIGTNNNYGDKPDAVAAGIKALVAEIRARQPQAKIILCGVFPRGEKPTDPKRIQNAAVNQIIRGYADGKDVVWLDLTDKLTQPDGTISKNLMPDFLHPKEAGYRLWADAMRPYFKQFCGK